MALVDIVGVAVYKAEVEISIPRGLPSKPSRIRTPTRGTSGNRFEEVYRASQQEDHDLCRCFRLAAGTKLVLDLASMPARRSYLQINRRTAAKTFMQEDPIRPRGSHEASFYIPAGTTGCGLISALEEVPMNGTWKRRLFLAFPIILLAFTIVLAQEVNPDRAARNRPSDERKTEPDLSTVTLVDRTPVLPSMEPPFASRLSTVDKLFLKDIKLEGGAILSSTEVTELAGPYKNREVTVSEIFELQRRFLEAYVQRGFVTSGVVMPDQKVENGVVVFHEVLGKLSTVQISGNGRLKTSYIRKRIETGAHEPLNISFLQNALELLKQDPMIRQVNARLIPGQHKGESELKVVVQRTRPVQVALVGDNQGSASTGGLRGTLGLGYMNPLGLGDSIHSDLGWSGGRWIGSAEYSIPVNAHNTRIQSFFSLDHARIIEEPFREIDIRSQTIRGGMTLTHPWLRNPARSLVSSVGIEKKHSESTLLGYPFSFSAGEHDGKADTTAVSLGLEYTARAQNHVIAARANLRRGLDLFNATINEHGADGEFTAFLGQFQYAQSLKELSSELLVRSSIQITPDPLLAVEKMPIGGLNTVRGYRENQLVRDNGLAASIEWRSPILRARSERAFNPLQIRFAPFFDYGRAWDNTIRLFATQESWLCSAGIGLLWNPIAWLRADLYWGHPFKIVAGRGSDLQDKGFHFTTSFRVPL